MDRRNTVLVVDDKEVNRVILCELFEEKYRTLEACNGKECLALLRKAPESVAVILLDVVMPVLDGFEVLVQLRQSGLLQRIPVVMITSDSSSRNEIRAFDLGAADIIMKPFDPHIVLRRVQNIIDLYQHKNHLEDLVQKQTQKLTQTNDIMVDTLSTVIEYRSMESGQHIRRIRMFTKILLESVAESFPEYRLNPEQMDLISRASAMHDIGKIAVPDAVLTKPGPLTSEEFTLMKTHTIKGCEILSNLSYMEDREYLGYCYLICRYHHERWNGAGYPEGLKGEEIPISAQVVAVADVYDALTSERSYKAAYPHQEAVQMILDGQCGSFSPRLLECFKGVEPLFDQLARDYADGLPAGFNPYLPLRMDADNAFSRPAGEYTIQDHGVMKYFAALEVLGGTTLEIDLETGMYHVIRQPQRGVKIERTAAFRSEHAFEEMIHSSVHPEDQEKAMGLMTSRLLPRMKAGERTLELLLRAVDPVSGGYHWHRVVVMRIDTANSAQYKILLFTQDVDESMREKEHCAFYERCLSLMPDAICSEILYFNLTDDTVLRVAGKESRLLYKEHPSGRFSDSVYYDREHFIHPDDRAAFSSIFSLEAARGHFACSSDSLTMNIRRLAVDGSYHWVEGIIVGDSQPNGDLHAVIFVRDMNKQKALEARLALLEARKADGTDRSADGKLKLEALVNAIPGGVARIWLDEEFHVELATDGFFALTGYTREEYMAPPIAGCGMRLILAEDQGAVLARIQRQLSEGCAAQAEYRMRKKDGSIAWIAAYASQAEEKNGLQTVHVVFIDITARRTAQKQLLLGEERYRILLEQTQDVVFEYNLLTRDLYCSPVFAQRFGYKPPRGHYKEILLDSPMLHPQDHPAARAMLDRLAGGESYAEQECRVRRYDGSFVWCKLKITLMRNEGSAATRAIGVLSDIDSYKRENEQLEAEAQRDQLTQLYNKVTVQKKIDEALRAPGASGVLFVVDIDDFKEINDSQGHLLGDAVLSELSAKLAEPVGAGGVLGRVGGDEFVAFQLGDPGEEWVQEQAQRITRVFGSVLTSTQQRLGVPFSGSVGIAVAPRDGGSYLELFGKADRALYASKKNGKNGWCVYSPGVENGQALQRYGRVGSRIENEKDLHKSFTRYVFNILYETTEMETAINVIFDLALRRYALGSIFILEIGEGAIPAVTYEWTADPSRSLKRASYYVDVQDRACYQKLCDAEGMLGCSDVSRLPPAIARIYQSCGIRAVMHAPTTHSAAGLLGFCDFTRVREWTKEEREACQFLARIVGLFLTRSRTRERLSHAEAVAGEILDGVSLCGCVVDEGRTILYANRALQERVGTVKARERCYSLFGVDGPRPCTDCPLAGLRRQGERRTVQRPGGEVLFTRIDWFGTENAYLILFRGDPPGCAEFADGLCQNMQED